MISFSNHAPISYFTHADRIQQTYERLSWAYGSARALRIVNGDDPAAISDQDGWRNFGRMAPDSHAGGAA